MILLGVDYLRALLTQPHFSAKMVFNERGAIIFPVKQQHRDMKAEGISYEDNYKGNALAAMLGPGKIEIRYHAHFADAQVARLMQRLLQSPELTLMAAWTVTYQGRVISVA